MFDCYKNNQFYYTFKLNLVGMHNVSNALASIAVCDCLNVKKQHMYNALKNFKGIERRFEVLNKQKFIVHDYAHHPEELEAVINQTKSFYKGKLLIVFQPHTYTRTKTLMTQFINCFKNFCNVVIFKTYSAREKYIKSGSAKTLAQNINAKYFNNNKEIKEYIMQKVNQHYGVLFLGAGNIDQLAKNINKHICKQNIKV